MWSARNSIEPQPISTPGAFAADSNLAGDLSQAYRFNAAAAASLAATGTGTDADKLDDQERMRLRTQALNWLRADLVLRGKQRQSGKPENVAAALYSLRYWQNAVDLAGLRDAKALEKLPAEERTVWRKFWEEVATLTGKTR